MIMVPANDSSVVERARYWMEQARNEARANRDPSGYLSHALHYILPSGHGLGAANTNDEEVTDLTKVALIFNGKSDMEQARTETGSGQHVSYISSAVTRAMRLGRIIAPKLDAETQLRAGLAALGTNQEEIAALCDGDIGVSLADDFRESRIEA